MKLYHIVLEDVDGEDKSGFVRCETALEALALHADYMDLDPEHFDTKARVFEIPEDGVGVIPWEQLNETELSL